MYFPVSLQHSVPSVALIEWPVRVVDNYPYNMLLGMDVIVPA